MQQNILFFLHSAIRKFQIDFIKELSTTNNIATICKKESVKNLNKKIPFIRCYEIPDLLKPEEWESNSSEISRLNKLISTIEKKNNFFFSKILLSNYRDIGVNLADDFQIFHHNKIRDYIRKRPHETNRMLRKILRFVEFSFQSFQPDYLILGETSSKFQLVASIYAKHNNIPLNIIRRSKILSNRLFFTDCLKMFSNRTEFFFKKNKIRNYNQAFKYLKKFREDPKVIKYIKSNWESYKKINLILSKDLIFSIISKKNILNFNFLNIIKKLAFIVKFNFNRIYKKSLYKKFNQQDLKKFKYVYFPLHKEPELTINFQSTKFFNQENLVSYISSSLPFNFKLLVKEHLYNDGLRKLRVTKKMTKLPNTYLIDPLESQFKYIKNSNLIITINGSSGWEGLIFNKPVITLEDKTFYSICDLHYFLKNLDELESLILKIDRKVDVSKTYDNKLIKLIDAEHSATFSDRINRKLFKNLYKELKKK